MALGDGQLREFELRGLLSSGLVFGRGKAGGAVSEGILP